MDQNIDLNQMLSLLSAPAFAVQDGVITTCNQAAGQVLEPGIALADLLQKECDPGQDDSLYVALNINGLPWGATVTRMGEVLIFALDPLSLTPELKAMSLLCNQLRVHVANLSLLVDGKRPEYAKKELAQVLRIMNNVSNAERFAIDGSSYKRIYNICGVLKEVFEESETLLKKANIRLRWQLPENSVYTLMDQQMVRQAAYALLDNAAKSTDEGGMIQAELALNGQQLRLTVTDHGTGIPDEIRGNLFSRYTRQPGIESGVNSLGLGMTLIRGAALSHGGTVLVEKLNTKGTRVTMTMALCDQRSLQLNEPRVDLIRSRDDALTMLSNVLPPELFK